MSADLPLLMRSRQWHASIKFLYLYQSVEGLCLVLLADTVKGLSKYYRQIEVLPHYH